MPTQWRTIAPIIGRTAAQCLEHYEFLLWVTVLLGVPRSKICSTCCTAMSFPSSVVVKYNGFEGDQVILSANPEELSSVNVSTLEEEPSRTCRVDLNKDRCIFSCFWLFLVKIDFRFILVLFDWLTQVSVLERERQAQKHKAPVVNWICSYHFSMLQRVSLGQEKENYVFLCKLS